MSLSACQNCKNFSGQGCLAGQSYLDVVKAVYAHFDADRRAYVASRLSPCAYWQESEEYQQVSQQVTLTVRGWREVAAWPLSPEQTALLANLIDAATGALPADITTIPDASTGEVEAVAEIETIAEVETVAEVETIAAVEAIAGIEAIAAVEAIADVPETPETPGVPDDAGTLGIDPELAQPESAQTELTEFESEPTLEALAEAPIAGEPEAAAFFEVDAVDASTAAAEVEDEPETELLATEALDELGAVPEAEEDAEAKALEEAIAEFWDTALPDTEIQNHDYNTVVPASGVSGRGSGRQAHSEASPDNGASISLPNFKVW